MKYICFYEFEPENMDKVIASFQKMQELRAQGSTEYPKALSPTYSYQGETKGFALFEVDTPQQITNHYIHYHPWQKFTWRPLTESSEFVAAYMKKK